MKEIISVNDFSFQYRGSRRRTLRKLNFSVEEGSFFCIIGANGSGKSTLCNALVGLVPHYFVGDMAGSITVDGHVVSQSSVSDLSASIGLVFQNPFNQLSYTSETVAEELAYGMSNVGIPRDEMILRIQRVSKLMRIDHILNRNPTELSGGQVQRVALGSCFIMKPRILVLDECTTQLDPLGSEEIMDIVLSLNHQGITVVMIDHDMERVACCADRIMVLDRGEIAAIDTPDKIFADPQLSKYGIEPPDYVGICRSLGELGMRVPQLCVTQEPTIELVRKALDDKPVRAATDMNVVGSKGE